jgi:hypothetical protein
MAQASVPESLAPPQSSTPLNSTTNQHGGNQKKILSSLCKLFFTLTIRLNFVF